MKTRIFYTFCILIATTAFMRTEVFGQLLVNENFQYPAGTQLVANGWAQTGTIATNPILISTPGLSYTGYGSSGIGNAAMLGTSGQDVNYGFTQLVSGTVYCGFLASVTSAQVNGDYFLHFIQAPNTSNVFKGRIWIKKDAASANFAFGITKSATAAASISYTGFNYTPGTTYLVVLKYKFNDGTLNDNVDLFINPALASPEPAPTISYIDNTQADATNLGFIALRQGSGTAAPAVLVDGIRIGQTWADIVGPPPIPTLSQWGLILLGLALLGAGSLYILRKG